MNRHLAGVEPTSLRVRTRDQFYDRAGGPISLSDWATRRRDPDYCRVGYWEGDGGAWIFTFWLGIDTSFGVGALPAIFDHMWQPSEISHTLNGPARPTASRVH